MPRSQSHHFAGNGSCERASFETSVVRTSLFRLYGWSIKRIVTIYKVSGETLWTARTRLVGRDIQGQSVVSPVPARVSVGVVATVHYWPMPVRVTTVRCGLRW
jgi:hypothetical protein